VILDLALTGLTAVFIAGPWSRWRWGFFDLRCFAAAFFCAWATPLLITHYSPTLGEFGIGGSTGGAFIGCLIYDVMISGWQ